MIRNSSAEFIQYTIGQGELRNRPISVYLDSKKPLVEVDGKKRTDILVRATRLYNLRNHLRNIIKFKRAELEKKQFRQNHNCHGHPIVHTRYRHSRHRCSNMTADGTETPQAVIPVDYLSEMLKSGHDFVRELMTSNDDEKYADDVIRRIKKNESRQKSPIKERMKRMKSKNKNEACKTIYSCDFHLP